MLFHESSRDETSSQNNMYHNREFNDHQSFESVSELHDSSITYAFLFMIAI